MAAFELEAATCIAAAAAAVAPSVAGFDMAAEAASYKVAAAVAVAAFVVKIAAVGLVEGAGLHLTSLTLLAVFALQLKSCLILLEQEEPEEEVVACTVAAEVASCTVAAVAAVAAVAEAS